MRSKVHFSNHRQLRCLCIKRSTVSKVLNLGPLGQDIQCHHRCQTSTVIEVKWKPGLLKSIVINLTLLLVYFKVFLIPFLSSLFRKNVTQSPKVTEKSSQHFKPSARRRSSTIPQFPTFLEDVAAAAVVAVVVVRVGRQHSQSDPLVVAVG